MRERQDQSIGATILIQGPSVLEISFGGAPPPKQAPHTTRPSEPGSQILRQTQASEITVICSSPVISSTFTLNNLAALSAPVQAVLHSHLVAEIASATCASALDLAQRCTSSSALSHLLSVSCLIMQVVKTSLARSVADKQQTAPRP